MKRLTLALIFLYTIAHFGNSFFAHESRGDWALHRQDITNWVKYGALEGKRPSLNSFDYTTAAPLHALLVVPLTYMSYSAAEYLNLAINLLCVLLTFYLASLAVPPKWKAAWWFWSFVVVANFRPFLMGMAMVKIEFIEILLMALALHFYRTEKDYWAGASLGAAAMIKYIPGFLIFYFLIRGEKKVVASFALACVAITLVTVGIFGWEHHVSFAQQLFSKQSWSSWIDNQSMFVAVGRAFAPFPPKEFTPEISLSHTANLVLWSVRIALGLALVYVTFVNRKDRKSRQVEMIMGLWLAFAPILIRFFRDYYTVLLYPFMLAMVLEFLENRPVTWVQKTFWIGMGLAYFLIGQGVPLGLFTRLPEAIPHYGNFNLFLYLAIPFWGVLVYFLVGVWGAAKKSTIALQGSNL